MFLAIYLKISGTYQLSVISYQLSVISYQLSVISYQLSVISYQLSVIRSQESGDCFYLFSYLPRKE
ncbi:MAG: hypothetical protein ACKPBT_15415, partial [Microcystis aeruginosa]